MLHNGNTLQLRRFSPQAIETLITWPQSLTEARWWAGPQTSWPVPIEAVQRWHDDPDVHPYILYNRATLLGYGELWVDAAEQEVELARLVVAPEHRGQGVGVALVRLLLEEARRTDYPRAFLRVFPDNHAAISCYLRAGFTPVSPSEQQSFNQGQPIDYLWMGCFPGQQERP
jgi:ribosomal protein S18 acetylase RimI-like enzyme